MVSVNEVENARADLRAFWEALIACAADMTRCRLRLTTEAGVDAEKYNQAIGNINGALMLIEALERQAREAGA
jgi:hypothetical protein